MPDIEDTVRQSEVVDAVSEFTWQAQEPRVETIVRSAEFRCQLEETAFSDAMDLHSGHEIFDRLVVFFGKRVGHVSMNSENGAQLSYSLMNVERK